MLKIAHHPIYAHPLPEGHRFPMQKYELLPTQLLYEGTCDAHNFFNPEVADDSLVKAVHTQAYIDDLNNLTLDKKRPGKLDFPYLKHW